MIKISYRDNALSKCRDLTPERLMEVIGDAKTKYNVEMYRRLKADAEACSDPTERKQLENRAKGYKILLPMVVWQGHVPEGEMPKNSNVELTGLYATDWDHVGSAEGKKYAQVLAERIAQRAEELGLLMVHVTPSGDGVRAVGRCRAGLKTLEENQKWLSSQFGLENDSVTCNKGRTWFLTHEYTYLSEELFADVDEGVVICEGEGQARLQRVESASQKASQIAEEQAGQAASLQSEETASLKASLQSEESASQKASQQSEEPASQPAEEQAASPASPSASGTARRGARRMGFKAFDLCVEQAGLCLEQMDRDGVRHNNLMSVLSVGLPKLLPKDELKEVVRQRMPLYWMSAECESLIDYFYDNYQQDRGLMSQALRAINAKCQEEDYEDDDDEYDNDDDTLRYDNDNGGNSNDNDTLRYDTPNPNDNVGNDNGGNDNPNLNPNPNGGNDNGGTPNPNDTPNPNVGNDTPNPNGGNPNQGGTGSTSETYALTAPPEMPCGVQEFVDACPTEAQKGASAMMAIMAWAVLLTHLRCKLQGRTLKLVANMLLYLWGNSGVGKTSLSQWVLWNILGDPEERSLHTLYGLDNLFMDYWTAMAKKQQALGGGAKKGITTEDYPMRMMSLDNTSAGLFKFFKDAMGLHVLLYVAEHDTLVANAGLTAWRKVDSDLRTLYDSGWMTKKTATLNGVSGRAQAVGCCLICGTQADLSQYYLGKGMQILKGLGNRTCFLHLEAEKINRRWPRELTSTEQDTIRTLAQKALDETLKVRMLTDEEGEALYRVEKMPQKEVQVDWLWDYLTEEFEQREAMQFLLDGRDKNVEVLVRCKEVATRCAMVLHWLWDEKDDDETRQKLKAAAMWVAQTMKNGMLELFQAQLDKPALSLNLAIPQRSVWEDTPEEFDNATLARVLKRHGRSESSYNVILKWKQLPIPGTDKVGVIEKRGKHYVKIKGNA